MGDDQSVFMADAWENAPVQHDYANMHYNEPQGMNYEQIEAYTGSRKTKPKQPNNSNDNVFAAYVQQNHRTNMATEMPNNRGRLYALEPTRLRSDEYHTAQRSGGKKRKGKKKAKVTMDLFGGSSKKKKKKLKGLDRILKKLKNRK